MGILSLGSCKKAPGGAESATEIIVGQFASISGGSASFGTSSNNGTLLAVDEVNANGGVLGKKIKLMTEDNLSKPGESTTIVTKLIDNGAVAILGEVASGRSNEGGPVCQAKKIPMISPASTNPNVTEGRDYVFRVCFIDPFQGAVMAKFAINTLKAKKAAVLTNKTEDYSTGLSKFFKEGFVKNGGEIVSEQTYNTGDKDYNGQLTSMKGTSPDVIFVPGYYGEIPLIAEQARKLGINVPLLGGDGWDSEDLFKNGKQYVEGYYFSNHYIKSDPSPAVQEFVKKYQAKYNSEPDAMAALGYDSVYVLAEAMKKAGTTEAAKLRDAIAATKDFAGVTGKITLDENRNASKSAVVLKIEGGKSNFVETVQP